MSLSTICQTGLAQDLASNQSIPMEIIDFSPQMIGGISPTQITELTHSQLRNLAPAQISGLTGSQVEALALLKPDTLSQLIDPSGAASWSYVQFEALSLDAMEAIPPLMLAEAFCRALINSN